MSQMIVQNPNLLPGHFNETGNPTGPSFVASLKNIPILGRIFTFDFQNFCMISGIIFYVAKAAMDVFTGAWMLALIEGATAILLANLRKKLIKAMDMEKAINETKKENHAHKYNNLVSMQIATKMKEEVKLLSGEREKLHKEALTFQTSNITYKELQSGTKTILEKAVVEIRNAAKNGENVGEKVLNKALKTLEQQQKVVEKTKKDLEVKQDETEKLWKKIVQNVSTLTDEEAKNVQRLQEIGEKLKIQNAQLESSIKANEATIQQLQKEIARLQKTVDVLNASAANVDRASTNVLGVSQGLKKNYNGDTFVPSDKGQTFLFFTGLAVVSFAINYLRTHGNPFSAVA